MSSGAALLPSRSSEAEADAAPSTIDGEPVLFRAQLDERFQCYRAVEGCCFGTWVGCAFTALPLWGLPYLWCGQGKRRSEAETFSLCVTPSAIHFRMKKFDCAWCCQTTTSKTIPLDKIQDVMLVSSCMGDCCGFAEPGKPWQVHVQTAGFSGGDKGMAQAELLVFCLANPEEFRSRVLVAKRALLAGVPTAGVWSGAAGAGKEEHGTTATAVAVGGVGRGATDMTAVVEVLERIEHAINDGLTRVGAGAGAGTAAGTGGERL